MNEGYDEMRRFAEMDIRAALNPLPEDLYCGGCEGHAHRLGPMADCALLDCTCPEIQRMNRKSATSPLDAPFGLVATPEVGTAGNPEEPND